MLSAPTIARRGMLAVIAGLALGCAAVGGENSGTGPSSGWSITATATRTDLTIAQASGDTIALTVTRAGGYTGAVTFEVMLLGNPSGITATLDNAVTANNVTTARLIVQVSSGFPPTTGQTVELLVLVLPSGPLQTTQLNFHLTITRKTGVFVNAPSTMSVGRGSTAGALITIIRTMYDVAVPFRLVNGPAGVSATFSPNPVTDLSTQMTLLADVSVPEGTYTFGVRANEGMGTLQATAPVTLTVTAPGSIVLSLNLPTLFIKVGSSVPTGINLTRTNFSGPVTLTFTGLPANVTVVPAANPVFNNNTSFTFTAAAGAIPGSYPITITGSGTGIADASVVLTLQVNP